MYYVRSLVDARWCVNHRGRDVKMGESVGFERHEDAQFFVNAGRAEFLNRSEALAVKMGRELPAREIKQQVVDVEQGEPVPPQPAKPAKKKTSPRKAEAQQ